MGAVVQVDAWYEPPQHSMPFATLLERPGRHSASAVETQEQLVTVERMATALGLALVAIAITRPDSGGADWNPAALTARELIMAASESVRSVVILVGWGIRVSDWKSYLAMVCPGAAGQGCDDSGSCHSDYTTTCARRRGA